MRYRELRSEDLRRIRGYIRRASRATSVEDLSRQAVEEIERVIPVEIPSWDNFFHSGDVRIDSYDNFLSAIGPRMGTFANTVMSHPILSGGGWEAIDGKTQRVSDWLQGQSLDDCPLYFDFYRHVGIKHQIGLTLTTTHDRRFVITLNRWNSDFTERDIQALDILGSSCGQIVQLLEERNRLTRTLDTIIEHIGHSNSKELLLSLSPSEIRLLGHLAAGHSYKSASREMDISLDTAHKRGSAIREKLGLENTAQLRALFYELRAESH